jgi:FtsH-binding integral membrane protein
VEVLHDPSNSPLFWVVVVIAFAVSAFFQFSHNARFKQQWWPVWLGVTTVLFTVFGWYLAGLVTGLLMFVVSVFVTWRLLKRTRFCDQCGRTVNSFSWSNKSPEHCPSCGKSLARAA